MICLLLSNTPEGMEVYVQIYPVLQISQIRWLGKILKQAEVLLQLESYVRIWGQEKLETPGRGNCRKNL